MKLLIASSAFNEEENIENFVKEIKINFDKFQKICKFPLDLELIIANNNSQDNTLEKLISLKKKFSFLRVYNINSNYGADISTLKAFNTSRASASSVSATSKCSSVANSCDRDAAFDMARRNVSSSSRDSMMTIPFLIAIVTGVHSA